VSGATLSALMSCFMLAMAPMVAFKDEITSAVTGNSTENQRGTPGEGVAAPLPSSTLDASKNKTAAMAPTKAVAGATPAPASTSSSSYKRTSSSSSTSTSNDEPSNEEESLLAGLGGRPLKEMATMLGLGSAVGLV
jgi:hypothetical protein